MSFLRCTLSACYVDCGHCRSLAPSCGTVQGNLLHLAQLCQQPLHAVFELRQTGQGFRGFQFPSVVQPALQHWEQSRGRSRGEHMVTRDVFLLPHRNSVLCSCISHQTISDLLYNSLNHQNKMCLHSVLQVALTLHIEVL